MPGVTRTKQIMASLLASLGPTVGNVFFVDENQNGASASAGYGTSPDETFSTIAAAMSACTANKGDHIIVFPGHTETITAASGVDFTKAGVTMIGLGRGAAKPTLTMSTSTAASLDFSAADCVLRNFRFSCGIDNLAAFIIGGAGGAVIEDCEFLTTSTQALSAITIPTTFDDWTIRRCYFYQTTDPAGTNGGAGTGAIYLVDSENVLIEDCHFRGNWETAFVHNKTTAAVNLWVRRCRGICSLADAVPFVLVSTATGGAEQCSFITPAETATTEATLSGTFGAGFFNFQSYFGNDGGGGQLAIASQSAAS